jgi:dTDP-4-dehydrorhamnose 3,5-epimerase
MGRNDGLAMILTETKLPGAYVLDLEPIGDRRGFFSRVWSEEELSAQGLETRIAQCSVSFNGRRGTLRGLHFQRAPYEEVKVVRCTSGALFDVIVDLRPESPAFSRWIGVELTADNRRALYVPRGFAHGFQTLIDGTEVFYMISTPYVPEASDGIRWNDPTFGIAWPLSPTEISDRDLRWPDFNASKP